MAEFKRQKMVLNFFTAKYKTFNFALTSFFLYDLFTNKVRKLEDAKSKPNMEYTPISLSLSVRVSFLLFCLRFISLSLYLSLSLSLSVLADAAFQLLLCGVMSSSLILINNEL